MTPRLPLEVVNLIIDDLAKYNQLSSIKACALVCHSFLPLCRKHIFASVTLNARQSFSPTSDDLNHLLSNSPHLAVYILNLDYRLNKKEFVKKRFLWLLPIVQEIGQVTESKHNLLLTLLTMQDFRLDVIVWTKSSPTTPPFSDSHQYHSENNWELSFGRFNRLCQSKKIGV